MSHRLTQELLLKAIEGEQNAIAGYEHMKSMAGQPEIIETLNRIILDEHKHLKSFEELFRRKFGKLTESPPMKQTCGPEFTDCIAQAVNDELESYEFYRDIVRDNSGEQIRVPFFDAMTDENEHAIRLNLMFAQQIAKRVM
ncbi:MAG: ferritin-like domain-containing protein [Oscillospiraceae bacterium]|nr:ferritin-like domain-containing protein [Oscillospiraceae bacterium]